MITVISTFEATAIVPADSQGPYTVDAGSPVTLSAGATHPDATYEWDLGDGATATTPVVVHTYADDGIYTAKLKVVVNQPGGGTSRHFATIRVRNVPPVVNAGPDRTVNEGDVIPFTGSFTDVQYPDTHEATWDWGDSQTPTAGVISETHTPPKSIGTVTASHAWGDSGTYTVTLSVRDEDGGVGQSTLTMNVLNVPPTVDAGPALYAYPCSVITLTAKFTDPGWLDTHTGTWEFGDCSPVQTAVIREQNKPPKGTGVAIASHTYECCGIYPATCVVTDDDGASGQDVAIIRVVDVENPGFESGFRIRTGGAVGNAWEPYRAEIPVFGKPPAHELEIVPGPEVFLAEEFPVHSCRRSQRIRFDGETRYGIRQRVGANAGWDYQISAWYSIAEQSASTARLGLDPTGGTDPTAASVIWSEGFDRTEWRQLAVRATVPQAGFLTIFLEARGGVRTDLPESVDNNAPKGAGHLSCDVYFDDVALLPVQPFCPDTTEPKPRPKPDTCTNFNDVPREKELPPVFQKDKFVFESMDHGPQHIVTWGPPPGQNKLVLHSGVIIHLPFPADRVRVDVASAPGAPIRVTAFNSGGGMVGQATSQPVAGVQTLEITGSDITMLKVQGGHGEGVLIGVCAHPDDSGKPAPGSTNPKGQPGAVVPARGIGVIGPGQT
jgi:PKD repeat protein